MLSSYLNFTYEVRPPSDIIAAGFMLANGSWTGAAGQLERKEVDLCVAVTAYSKTKSRIMDLSYPVIWGDTAIIIPFPHESSKWTNASAFDGQVWTVLGVTFFFMILTAWGIHRVTNVRSDQSQNTIIYWIYYFLSLWANQGISIQNSSTAFRVVILFSAFGIYLISNFFTAAYTSILSAPILKTSINSVEDLANSENIKTLMPKGSVQDEYYSQVPLDPVAKKFSEQMRRHPERKVLNAFTVKDISKIVKADFALIMGTINAQSLVQQSYEINKECRVTLANKNFFSITLGFPFPKKSPLATSLDKALILLHEYGLTEYAMRQSTSITYKRCSIAEVQKSYQSAKPVPLKLSMVVGAFFILMIGYGLGFVTFLTELVVSRLKAINSSV